MFAHAAQTPLRLRLAFLAPALSALLLGGCAHQSRPVARDSSFSRHSATVASALRHAANFQTPKPTAPLITGVVDTSGDITTFTYDDSQRLSSTTDPVGTIALTRDAAGRVTIVTEGTKTLTRAYNAYGWLTTFTDGDGNTIGYTYDNLGRLTKLTYPGTPTKEVLYAYDAAGRLHTVTDWASRVTTYSYDAVSRLSQTLRPNGTKQVRTYDAAGQLTSVTELAPDGVTVIYSGNHSYDLAGQLTSETLIPSLSPPAVSATQTFDADNRLLTHNGSAVTFDADGNLLTIASGVAPASYAYDARNRLTSAGSLTYGYDAENRRVSVTDGSGATSYAINPNAVPDQVLVRTAPGGVKTFYVYGLGLLHEETSGTPRYYHHDRRGDTIALTDSTGIVTGRAAYGVYGELITQSGTLNTPFLFNGRWGVQTDTNGLYHHRARYYHPALRRFLNQDTVLGSITDSASLNRFAYANGNPVSMIDPFGFMAIDHENNLWKQALLAGLDSGNRYAAAFLEGLKVWKWPQAFADFAGAHAAAALFDTRDYFGWDTNIAAAKQQLAWQFGTAEGWGNFNSALFAASFAGPRATTSAPVLVATENASSTALSTFRRTTAGETFQHYGYSEHAGNFSGGLRPAAFATPVEGLSGAKAQSGLALPHATPPNAAYTVTPQPGTWVRVNPVAGAKFGQPGGLPEVQFPNGTGPGTVSGPRRIP